MYKIGAAGLLLVLALGFIGGAQAEDIVLVADPWPPFNMAPGSNREGYIIDIAREVFQRPAGGNAGQLRPDGLEIAPPLQG